MRRKPLEDRTVIAAANFPIILGLRGEVRDAGGARRWLLEVPPWVLRFFLLSRYPGIRRFGASFGDGLILRLEVSKTVSKSFVTILSRRTLHPPDIGS